MERQSRQSADIPKWSALLIEAVNKPGLIMKAYSNFHSYSLGNQLLALVQGIKDFRFHDLRHTAATRMADCGADAFTLAAIFGWPDVRMALRYTHATDEAMRRAVENLVRPVGPSDESVTNEKGRVATLP